MMERLDLPNAVEVYRAMRGELEFSFFDAVLGTNCTQKDSILAHLKHCIDGRDWTPKPEIRLDYFDRHHPLAKTRHEFLGRYYDFHSKKLGWPEGDNPSEYPLDFSQGDTLGFSYFAARPVYGPVKYGTNNIHPEIGEWEAAIEAIVDEILPLGRTTDIYDWCRPELDELTKYFSGGLEFGLANLYLLSTPSLHRVVVISESTWN
jgi:hypothetical protein